MEFPLETGLGFGRASYEPLLHSKGGSEALEAFEAKRLVSNKCNRCGLGMHLRDLKEYKTSCTRSRLPNLNLSPY